MYRTHFQTYILLKFSEPIYSQICLEVKIESEGGLGGRPPTFKKLLLMITCECFDI
jgi:hypothetical protein